MPEELRVKTGEHPVTAPPTAQACLGFGLKLLLWTGGGIALAYGLSLGESHTHQDTPEFAQVRLIGNMVLGGVVGLVTRLMRFAQSGR